LILAIILFSLSGYIAILNTQEVKEYVGSINTDFFTFLSIGIVFITIGLKAPNKN
jgi:hypothetical protein